MKYKLEQKSGEGYWTCITQCSFFVNIKVGSGKCYLCKYRGKINNSKDPVIIEKHKRCNIKKINCLKAREYILDKLVK